MVPFKEHYVSEDPPFKRAVSVQRCLRLSDLDEVGRTPYHGTFFEMLGNFSFGDYFKADAIPFAWNLITKEFGLDAKRLRQVVAVIDVKANRLVVLVTCAVWRETAFDR